MSDLLELLRERDLLIDRTEGLDRRAREQTLAGYVGFDPTAGSLHVGHLTSVRLLQVLAESGGRPVALIGGGTGLIGDPSGKSRERPLLEPAALDRNRERIEAQLRSLLGSGIEFVDNRDWLGPFGLLDFLRDIGKHISVGEMLARDSVTARLETGLSFTEFSYALLQATDFLTLHRDRGVDLQMGGSDQWGNITAGIDLIRRVLGKTSDGFPRAFGAVAPLLTTSDGRKMGKTEAGAVFLDPALTSPFDFFQFWINVEDAQVGSFLRRLTTLPIPAIHELEDAQIHEPAERPAQRALAFEVTAWVHGPEAAAAQRDAASAAFGARQLDAATLSSLFDTGLGFDFSARQADSATEIALASGLLSSRGEVARMIRQGGLRIGDVIVRDGGEPVTLVERRFVAVRVGKRRVAVGRLMD